MLKIDMEEGDNIDNSLDIEDPDENYFDSIEKIPYNLDIPIEPPPAVFELQSCPICTRNFNSKTYKKHVVVCERVATKKRKAFDSSRQRREGTDFANYLPKNYGIIPIKRESSLTEKTPTPSPQPPTIAPTPMVNTAPTPDVDTPPKHREPVQKMALVRKKTVAKPPVIEEKKEIKETAKPVAKRSFTQQPTDQCPHCDRCFGVKAYDRHVEWCREKSLIGKNNSSASISAAKERLQARIKYKAPNMKKETDESPPQQKDNLPKKLSDKANFHQYNEMVKTDSKSSTENIMAAVALKKKKLSVSKNDKRISGSSDRSLDDLNSIDDISMIEKLPTKIKKNIKLGKNCAELKMATDSSTTTSVVSSIEDIPFDMKNKRKTVTYLYKNPKNIITKDKIIHSPSDEKIPFINNIKFKTENIISTQEDSSTVLLKPPFYDPGNSISVEKQNSIMIKEFQNHHKVVPKTHLHTTNESTPRNMEIDLECCSNDKTFANEDPNIMDNKYNDGSFHNQINNCNNNNNSKAKSERHTFLSSKEKSFIIEKSYPKNNPHNDSNAKTQHCGDDSEYSKRRLNKTEMNTKFTNDSDDPSPLDDYTGNTSKFSGDSAYNSISPSKNSAVNSKNKSAAAATSTTSLRHRLRVKNKDNNLSSSGSESSMKPRAGSMLKTHVAKEKAHPINESKLSKFCHQCGVRFHQHAKFCMECGIRRIQID